MNLFAFMPFNLGVPELIVICVIGILLFGRKLPEIGRSIGQSIVQFRKGIKGIEEDMDSPIVTKAEKKTETPVFKD